MKTKVDFKHLAHKIKFTGFSSSDVDEMMLEYRKGKGFEDIRKAVRKAHKNGFFRTECEIDMLEIYLKEVFKLNHS